MKHAYFSSTENLKFSVEPYCLLSMHTTWNYLIGSLICKKYIIWILMAFAFCPFWNKIIVSEFWVLVVMGSIWIPQIISLAISGKKNTINGSFIYLSALQSMFLPLYINLIDDNIMFLYCKKCAIWPLATMLFYNKLNWIELN